MDTIEKLAEIVKANIAVAAATAALKTAYDLDADSETMAELSGARNDAHEKLNSLIDRGHNDYAELQSIFSAACGI